ncbi:MAG: glutathione S-transferase family protein [Pseudomonadota bacterium]
MTYTFYTFPKAPSPRRAEIVLLEKGIAYDEVVVDIANGEHLGEAYRAINPACTVPTLRIANGPTLTDNAGILAYLDAKYPEKPLLGSGPAEKASIATWCSKVEFDGLLAVAEVLRNVAPAMKGRALTGPVAYEQIPELAQRGARRLGVFWDVLNEALEGRDYLASDDFSAADLVAVVAVDFSKVVKSRPPQELANLWRWRDNLNNRASIAKTTP